MEEAECNRRGESKILKVYIENIFTSAKSSNQKHPLPNYPSNSPYISVWPLEGVFRSKLKSSCYICRCKIFEKMVPKGFLQ